MHKPTAIVIGGGIHGLTAALALSEAGVRVSVVEKNAKLLAGTSGATHNRAHIGYHYPRCLDTARECLRGLDFFKRQYPQALYYPEEAYYTIAREGSKTSADEFRRFCERVRIPYEIQWPASWLLAREQIENSFRVPEPCFNLEALGRLLNERAERQKVRIHTDTTVTASTCLATGSHRVQAKGRTGEQELCADMVVNAAYARTGNIMALSELEADQTDYQYHTTEVVVARGPGLNIPALTVMDGPFISVMPYAGWPGHFLVYDVENSVAHRQEGREYHDPGDLDSRWPQMVAQKQKFFPFLPRLEYVQSLWGSRPVPVDCTLDTRKTRIISHRAAPGFYSILEGKFISAPLVARELVDLMRSEGRIP